MGTFSVTFEVDAIRRCAMLRTVTASRVSVERARGDGLPQPCEVLGSLAFVVSGVAGARQPASFISKVVV